MSDRVLAFEAIGQDFPAPGQRTSIRVLDGISFGVDRGKFVAVIGPSGCGKSTLLQMAAGGIGITLMPELAVKAEIAAAPGLVVRPLEREPAREIALA